MFTLVAIERKAIAENSQYIAVKNRTYVQLAQKLQIRNKYFSNANNTGNVLESLCWLAYEKKEYNFILSIAKFAADFEYPRKAVPGPAAAVATGPTASTLKRPAERLDNTVVVAPGPATAGVPGPAKVRRKQSSARVSDEADGHFDGKAAWFQGDVQGTAAPVSGHAAGPASNELGGTWADIQDYEPSDEEKNLDDPRCMNTWAREKLEDYEKLNKYVQGRQADMERQADWFHSEMKRENAKRQARHRKGQTLQMLQRTATSPDTDLPTYLHAYLHLCGTKPEVWKTRFQTLAQRFGLDWSALRNKMAVSTAEPKYRNDEELEEAFRAFKRVYKEASMKRWGKQNVKPMHKFWRDIFGDMDGFLEYLRSGGVRG